MALDLAAQAPGAVPIWVRGALICLFGSTLTALGLVLQKHSHIVSDMASGAAPAYFMRKWWILGFAIFLSAQIINMVAMAMTPQVVLSCLGAWTLVCNAFFAHFILGEKISCSQSVAVAGLVVATTMVIYNAPRPTAEEDALARDVDVLAARFLSPEFQLLTVVLFGLVCLVRSMAAGVVCPVFCVARALAAPSMATPSDPASADAVAMTASLARRSMVPASWAMAAAVAAGYTALLFKCIAEIIAGAAARPGAAPAPWHCWVTYVIVGVALSCAPAELHFLNLALRCGEAVLVVPTYLALGMLAQLATGAVFFQELRDFHSASHAVGFGLSVLLTLIFVVLMAKAQAAEAERVAGVADGDVRKVSLVNAPELSVKLVPELLADYLTPLDELSSDEARHVSVAGFGGAIECLEATRGRGRQRSDGGSKVRGMSAPF